MAFTYTFSDLLGGRQPQSITITLDDAAIPWANRVKYLGCYFLSLSGDVDLSVFICKICGSFNNILNVLGHYRNEILAVHLVKTYCLPAAVYGGEVWSPTSSALKSLSVA